MTPNIGTMTIGEIEALVARAEKAEAELAAWRAGNPSDDLRLARGARGKK
jgi:hypothetical protein